MTVRFRLAAAGLALLVFAPRPANAAYHAELEATPFVRIIQDSDGGKLLLQRVGNSVNVTEGAGSPFSIAPVEALEVVIADGSGSGLELAFDDPLAGDLTLELGTGDRLVKISGDSPELGGDLVIHAGAGRQVVSVTASQPLHASGDILLDGVNAFDSPSVPVEGGGDLRMTTRRESARMELDLFYLDLEGDLVYQGSDDLDYVELGFGAVEIRGNMTVDLGDGVSSDGYPYYQVVRLRSGMNGSPRVAGRMSVRGGDVGNPDLVEVESGADLVRGLRVALGDGENYATVSGTGGAFQYSGGDGPDSVTLGLAAPSAKLKLGDGADTLSLVQTLALGALSVDFGRGTDTYEIEVGTNVPANAKIKSHP